ncbi:MAG: hypothetical protein IKB96_06220 [Prevotella sp.]|nr:hypothetical protein [Prevotella sp.]
MGEQKNLKADKPMFTGRIMFDGNIQVRIPQHGIKTLRTDLAGMKLQKADPNKELLVFTNHFVGYNEIHTGYIVRMKQYDDMERPCFGLKHEPDADSWTVINYCDVIAWGYADGGLNDPTLFYSCQSTVEEEIDRERRRAEKGMKTHAEKLAELEAELDEEDDDDTSRRCVKLRYEDGEIHLEATLAQDEPFLEDDGTNHVKGIVHDCAKVFDTFRKEHPDVTEMHFYTDDKLAMEE